MSGDQREKDHSATDLAKQHNDDHQDVVEDDGPPRFFCVENMKYAQANMFAGLLSGYGIGFVGPYTTMYDWSTDCSQFKSPSACTTLSNAKCGWNADDDDQPCMWRTEVNCYRTYTNEGDCSGDSACAWMFKDSFCQNKHGYTTVESGLFAGAMVLGCMCSGLIGGWVCKTLGVKMTFVVSGFIACVGCACYHICTALTLFWLLVVSRVVIGFAVGLCTVAAPLYVNVNAHPKYAQEMGVMFQIFNCLGIFIASLVAIFVGQTIDYKGSKSADLKGRMQGFCAVASLISVLVIGMGLWLPQGQGIAGEVLPEEVPEENVEGENVDGEEGEGEVPNPPAAAPAPESEPEQVPEEVPVRQYTYCEMLPRLLVGVVVAGTLQLTGVNAVMSFAPTIMGNIGLEPLIGNIIVMAWNFVTAIVSVPLSSLTTVRKLFLASSAAAALACVFLCGIPVIPGVASTNVKNGVAITGIMVYIMVYEFGVGPCFYVLAQELFPPSFRPKGSSVVMVVQFFFNLLINAFYPSVTMAVSGGASGNQDKGQAAAFLFFGGVGILCFVIQVFFLHPWQDTDEVPETDNGSGSGKNVLSGRVDDGSNDE